MGSTNVAVVGAASLIGEAIIDLLAQAPHCWGAVHALDGAEAVGRRAAYGRSSLPVDDVTQFDFARVGLILSAATGSAAEQWIAAALAAGRPLVDAGGALRSRSEVPLMVAGVNDHVLFGLPQPALVGMPSSVTIALARVLAPLQQAAGLARVVLACFEPASAAGRAGVEELARQSADLLGGKRPNSPRMFPRPIAFNVLPRVGDLDESGYTNVELEVMRALPAVLGDPSIRVSATATQAPVFFGLGIAVQIELWEPLGAEHARDLLAETAAVLVADDGVAGGFSTAVAAASARSEVLVGRIRADASHANGLVLWLVADSIRACAASNCVRLAEILGQ
jgi:aspartate-semialdehyde dehydrogenase